MGKPNSRGTWFMAVLLWASTGAAGADGIALVLTDLSGKDRRVNEYVGQGRWVVMPVWSLDCPVCRREMYHMTFLYEQHKDNDIRVVGLSIDGDEQRERVKDFVDEQSLNFPTLIGDPAQAHRLSGRPFEGTPTYYFFAPSGKFMQQHVGAMTQGQAERTVERLKKKRQSPGRR